MDKQQVKNLAERVREAIGAQETAETRLEDAKVEVQNWMNEAVLFCYENGYSSGDDVRMLLSWAAFGDTEQMLELLDEAAQD